jgi:hypothetical protein
MTLRPVFLALWAATLSAQDSEVPLGLNLPTAERLQDWQSALRFTHRFMEQARGNGKDLYGLDGGNSAGLGLDLGVGALPGLNAQVYRTPDGKTLILGLQQQLLKISWFRVAVRGERFDETVQRATFGRTTLGISGAALQLPADFLLGPLVLGVVPTVLTRTSTDDRRVSTFGASLRWTFAEGQAVIVEHYPKPGGLPPGTYHSGFAFGYRFQTQRHRFTLLGTNAQGTTAHQVLGGGYNGGPVEPGQWSLGFNLVRLF